jgi:hypothetical protein
MPKNKTKNKSIEISTTGKLICIPIITSSTPFLSVLNRIKGVNFQKQLISFVLFLFLNIHSKFPIHLTKAVRIRFLRNMGIPFVL